MPFRKTLYKYLKQPFQRGRSFNQRVESVYSTLEKSDISQMSGQYLGELLKYTVREVPYYHKLAAQEVSLGSFPIVNKDILRESYDDFQAAAADPSSTYRNASGGSTGTPLALVQDSVYAAWGDACERYFYRKFLRVEPDEVKKVVLWGSPRDLSSQTKLIGRINNFFNYTTFINCFEVKPDEWLEFARVINRVKPVFIKGYAVSVYLLAKALRAANFKVFNPKFIYVSAETLTAEMRKEIEEVFQCKVYDFYGSREVGPIAAECPAGSRHVFNFHNIVEVADLTTDTMVSPGTEGRLIVTNLHNLSMPIVRYDIGDLGSLSPTICSCGCELPVLSSLSGRITDHLVGPEGVMIHGGTFSAMLRVEDWVREFQVNQYKLGELEVLVVPTSARRKERQEAVIEKMKRIMGKDCEIQFKIVECIQRTPQGKLRYTRNLLHV